MKVVRGNSQPPPQMTGPFAVILLPLSPASLMHKNPQRRKIIRGMCPVGRKDRSIDLDIL